MDAEFFTLKSNLTIRIIKIKNFFFLNKIFFLSCLLIFLCAQQG